MLKDVIERSPVIVLATVFFTGATITFGTMMGILDFANQDIVTHSTYTKNDDIPDKYAPIQDYNRIKDQLDILIARGEEDEVRQLYALKIGLEGMRKSLIAALEKRCPESHTCNYISSAGVKLFNSLAHRYNGIFSDQPLFEFPEDTNPNSVEHPEPLEVMSQVELALALLDGKLKC